jgi:hypothetical protein
MGDWPDAIWPPSVGCLWVVSSLGLRTFGKWQREKVHEKKLEIAFEALSIA